MNATIVFTKEVKPQDVRLAVHWDRTSGKPLLGVTIAAVGRQSGELTDREVNVLRCATARVMNLPALAEGVPDELAAPAPPPAADDAPELSDEAFRNLAIVCQTGAGSEDDANTFIAVALARKVHDQLTRRGALHVAAELAEDALRELDETKRTVTQEDAPAAPAAAEATPEGGTPTT